MRGKNPTSFCKRIAEQVMRGIVKKTNIAMRYKIKGVVESHDPPSPEGTRHIEVEIGIYSHPDLINF